MQRDHYCEVPGFFLAGEYMYLVSCVEGALRSGEKAAAEILSHLRKLGSDPFLISNAAPGKTVTITISLPTTFSQLALHPRQHGVERFEHLPRLFFRDDQAGRIWLTECRCWRRR